METLNSVAIAFVKEKKANRGESILGSDHELAAGAGQPHSSFFKSTSCRYQEELLMNSQNNDISNSDLHLRARSITRLCFLAPGSTYSYAIRLLFRFCI